MAISKKEYQVSDLPRNKKGLVNGNFQDLTSQRFGRLTIVSFWGQSANKMSYWNCICDCGNISIAQGAALKNGNTTSCGCYHKERISENFKTHGMCDHPLYSVWDSMNARCNDPNAANYQWYGGFVDPEKGIPQPVKVCWQWNRDNPEGCKNFCHYMDTVMPIPSYDKYPSGYAIWSLDRIDPDGHYEPNNVKWATASEQQLNKRFHKLKEAA